jgi:hypothetical protein
MLTRATASADVAGLVDHMFAGVFTPEERAELLIWIREWEAANPDVDSAHRITGWIDVAYAFQSRRPRTVRTPAPAAAHPVRTLQPGPAYS